MTDFWSRAKRINNIQTSNSDPLLSQFKHHFTILKVYLPRKMNLQSFAQRVPQGFGLANNSFSNTIYIAQFVNVYDNDLVDIAIGFRRDQTAIQIATGSLLFKYDDNRIYKVELSNGFGIFMDDLRNQEKQIKSKDDSILNQKLTQQKARQSKGTLIRKESKMSQSKGVHVSRSRSRSRSRSGSRSRQKKKQIFNRISSGAGPQLQKSLSDRLESEKRN